MCFVRSFPSSQLEVKLEFKTRGVLWASLAMVVVVGRPVSWVKSSVCKRPVVYKLMTQ
jgi:hypothetical protein